MIRPFWINIKDREIYLYMYVQWKVLTFTPYVSSSIYNIYTTLGLDCKLPGLGSMQTVQRLCLQSCRKWTPSSILSGLVCDPVSSYHCSYPSNLSKKLLPLLSSGVGYSCSECRLWIKMWIWLKCITHVSVIKVSMSSVHGLAGHGKSLAPPRVYLSHLKYSKTFLNENWVYWQYTVLKFTYFSVLMEYYLR